MKFEKYLNPEKVDESLTGKQEINKYLDKLKMSVEDTFHMDDKKMNQAIKEIEALRKKLGKL